MPRIVVGDVVRVVLSPFNPARGRLYAPGRRGLGTPLPLLLQQTKLSVDLPTAVK